MQQVNHDFYTVSLGNQMNILHCKMEAGGCLLDIFTHPYIRYHMASFVFHYK